MLVHDHGTAGASGAGRIRFLMAIGSLGKWNQDRGGSADGQLTEAACTRSADRQIGMLQQAGDLITEGEFHQVRMLKLSDFRVVATSEMHDPASLLQQLRNHSADHAVEPDRALAATDHHQQRAVADRHPVR